MIHPTAVIHPGAQVGEGCEIGPYCVIGQHVVLGARCRLYSHVVIDGHTVVGPENEFFPFCSIGLRTQDLKWRGGVTRTQIGERNTFREYVTVHSATNDGGATVVGSHNNLLAYSHVAHDCRIGSHIIMSNAATLGGHVVVEDHAVVSISAVHQFCRIGKMAMIGGYSKVVQDIPPFMLAQGNPAKTLTVNKIGMERNGVSDEAQTAVRQAYKIIFREKLTVPNALTRVEQEVPRLPEIACLLSFIRASERGISR